MAHRVDFTIRPRSAAGQTGLTGRTGDFRPSLLEHLVSGGQQRLGDSEAEGAGSLHVDGSLDADRPRNPLAFLAVPPPMQEKIP